MRKFLLIIFSIIAINHSFSQCTITASVVDSTFDCNDSIEISLVAFANTLLAENFNCPGGPCDPNWLSTGGAQFDNPYDVVTPSPSGDTYFWMGPGAILPKTLTSGAYNITGSVEICFDMVYAGGSNGSPIEALDEYHEGVGVQYNTGNGVWVDIIYWSPQGDTLPANPIVNGTVPSTTTGPFITWHNFCIDVPIGAIGPNTSFRWIQEENSGANVDHWGLDNITINVSSPDYSIIFNNNGNVVGSSPNSVTVTPTTDSLFEFTYIALSGPNAGQFCTTDVLLTANPTDAGPDITVSCSTLGIPLQLNGVNQDYGNVVWSPSLGLDDPNALNPYANPVNDQMYTVTSDCGVDSTFVNVVPIFDIETSSPNDSICVNDVATIMASSPDQPLNNYTYQWTNYVTDDTSATTTVSPSINTTYYVEMVSDSGCVRNDSIEIFVGAVPKTINYTGEMRICRGDSTQVTAVGIQPTIFDDFDNNGTGINFGIWSDIQNGTANTDCGSVSGNALHFNGTGDRWAQTIGLNVLPTGGTISFDIVYGGFSAPGTSCNFVSFGEDVQLEYSIDGGVTWIVITDFSALADYTWTNYQIPIPAGATGPNTLFRFNQPNHSGNNSDNWAIDNLLIELDCTGTGCVNYTYTWTPTTFVSDPNIANPYFYPNVTTDYSLSISPEGFNCNAAADIITIEVDELPFNITPEDTFLCEPSTVLLNAELGLTNCDAEYAISQVPINMLTGTNINVPLTDESTSPFISLPFDFEFFCETKNQFRIGSNGFVTFSSTLNNGCCSGQNIPNANFPNDLIALMWGDLNPGTGGVISQFVVGSSPNRVQVVEFSNVPHWLGNTETVSGQIQMFETSNIIEVHCLDCVPFNDNVTMGIENSTGTKAFTPPGYNANTWTATNEAWRFVPSNSPANFNLNWTPNVAITDITIPNPLVTPLSTTTYTLEVTNINNCAFYDSATVHVFEGNANITATPNPVCYGQTVQLEATGADSYTWTPATDLSATNIANPVSSTLIDRTYYVNFNSQGCTQTDSIRVDVLALPETEINYGANPVGICEGATGTLFVDTITGWSYSWTGPENGNEHSLDITTPGTYEVLFSNGSCEDIRTVEVVENEVPKFDFSEIDSILCCEDDMTEVVFNDIITNNSSINIQDIYVNAVTTTDASITYVSTTAGNNITNDGDILKVVTAEGCETEAEMPYIATKCANPSFNGPDTIYLNTTDVFDLTLEETGADNTSYAWSTSQASAIEDASAEDANVSGLVDGPHTITVLVTNTYDGKDEPCSEETEVQNYYVVEIADPQYPDAFTPKNGDTRNNVFRPVVSEYATIKEFRVYNRWGHVVYDMSTADNKDGWDGTWNDVDQEADLYIYYMLISHPDKDFVKEGTVTLLR